MEKYEKIVTVVERIKKILLKPQTCALTILFGAAIIIGFTVKNQGAASIQLALQNSPISTTTPINPPVVIPAPTNIKTVAVQDKDYLGKIFRRLNLKSHDADLVLALKDAAPLKRIRPKQNINFTLDKNNQWQSLSYAVNDTDTLVVINIVTNDNTILKARIDHITPTSRLEYVTGTVQGTLSASAQKAGIPSPMMQKFITLFQDQVNLKKSVRDGDHFDILYNQQYVQDKAFGKPEIVAAELAANNKTYKTAMYTDGKGNKQYYDSQGYALESAFVRAPIHYKRISSLFSLNRYNPVLHIYRPHLGVDFAAPMGTPVKATSSGRIAVEGVEGGYGKVVIVQHDKKYSSLYAHLSRFPKDIHPGSFVKQGQVIGYLGETGIATGPHVHYEFRANGVHCDPLKVKLPHDMLAGSDLKKFFAQSRIWLAQIDAHHTTNLAENYKSDSEHKV